MAINSKKGYTLLELMLTVAIIGIVGGMSAPLLTQMTNFWPQTSARNTIQRDVRHSLDLMNRFIRQGQSGTVVIDAAANQPSCSRITFTSIQGQTVSFYQEGNKLHMRLSDNISTLSNSIAYIAFTYPRSDDVSLISVSLTAQSSTYRGGKKALQLSIQKVRIMN